MAVPVQAARASFIARIRGDHPNIDAGVLEALALTYDQRYYAMAELDAIKEAMIEAIGWEASLKIFARSRELLG